ncbi:hypothetical protein [Acidovorax sp. FJL06]|uniref:hypothetical protein n=1 Tax=Acidovorax sp. FJL06 TaxID=2153365 RepID=UPI001315A354|nr:hypothetical protein [Acidovorax sp. FJL06]
MIDGLIDGLIDELIDEWTDVPMDWLGATGCSAMRLARAADGDFYNDRRQANE